MEANSAVSRPVANRHRQRGLRMLTELGEKAAASAKLARRGELKCPLMVRATSEDVVTGNIFTCLQAINPRWWLPDLLNTAIGCNRFSTQILPPLYDRPLAKAAYVPCLLLPWEEGKTDVDVEISWENPPTTVFIEMKYGSPLSATTVNNNGQNGHASDQSCATFVSDFTSVGGTHRTFCLSKQSETWW